ncbi:sensor histidine kinase [Actinomyces provencensis]|uniref:sensor histidine kinase n=1 Tax=Actinomyces provencensis TaxID=1720198 RepID=UPI00098E94CC|nr:ATP-binding protein [Actinomyces provencensis]
MSTWPALRWVRQTLAPEDAAPPPGADAGAGAGTPPATHPTGGPGAPGGGGSDPVVDPVVLVVGDGSRGLAPRVRGQVEGGLPRLRVEGLDAPPSGPELDAALGATGVPVLVVLTNEVTDIGAAVAAGALDPRLADLGWILVTDPEEHRDLAPVIPSIRFRSVLSLDHGPRVLLEEVADAAGPRLRALGIDEGDLATFLGPRAGVTGGTPVIQGLDREDSRSVEILLRGIREVLGPCPRIILPAGTVLTRQDELVGAVHLLLSGGVALRRDAERATVLLHRATTGPIIGLVSLVRGQRAYFTATTTVPTVVVRLSHDQLARVVREDSESAEALTVLTIHSLTRRLVRAEELHVEKGMLAADLEADRAELAQALEDLRSTRAELVERTRFAMLGELSAGVAHELNNPLSAMTRSTEHLRRDVVRLLGQGGMDTAVRALRRTREAPPRSTSEERALLKELLGATDGDRAAARRMLRLGVSDVGTARVLLASPDDALKEAELGARIGSSLRSITAASQRVTGLAQSLRSYARPEGEALGPVDVRASLDDALRLTSHRLHGIRVETRFGEVPPVLARSGSLDQVWMNLLVNAADAFEDEREDLARADGAPEGEGRALPARGTAAPRIVVEVAHEDGAVVVEVSDNGPGIPEGLRERIFEPHFTTRAGRVRYGLGMGLSIVSTILTDAGGGIEVESGPGATRVRVTLVAVDEGEGES